MKLQNLRLGFATNSSSSHSIVIHDGLTRHDESGVDYGYGWGDFYLTDADSKLHYLATMILTTGSEDEELVRRIDNHHPGFYERFKNSGGPAEYVDHQSVFIVNEDNIDRYARLFVSDRIAIRGGNDNEEGKYDNAGTNFPTKIAHASRVKFEGPYVIVMDSRGNKARVALEDDAPDYVKSATPELVDVKITDYCNRGCNFCYQSSTEAGKHAPLEDIIRTFDMLSEMEVFEVALGGGEPTSHPDFATILRAASERKIVPNFTTLSDKWLEDDEVVAVVRGVVGGIGVSCLDSKGLRLAEKIKSTLSWGPTVMAQHVMESVPLDVTTKLIGECFKTRMPLLLLGYKNVGFGKTYERFSISDDQKAVLVNLVRDWEGRNSLSVDTAVIDQYGDVLEMLEIDPVLYSSPEGKFSCYVDLVLGRMAKSSYVEDNEYVPLPRSTEGFISIYREY